MKTVKSIFLSLLAMGLLTTVRSQDSSFIKQQAYLFADSLLKADRYENWDVYAALSPTRAVRYYGGKTGFLDNVKVARIRTQSIQDEVPPALELLQLKSRNNEWQCVIKSSRVIHRDDYIPYNVRTYLVGQSKDDGQTWVFLDVGNNAIENVIYLMPDIFDDLAIPEPEVVRAE